MRLLPSLHENNCQRCKLCTLRKQIVPSYLPEDAEVLFLSEGPGKIEDDEGTQPLIGPAGQFFNTCLKRAGLGREDPRFAFSNTIRCRPKEIDPEKIKIGKQNRLPKDSEIKACSHYLDEEIKSLKKLKLIVALGAVALKRLFGKSGIKSDQARGTILNHPIYGPVLVTYHPAKPLHVKDTQERAAIESSIIEDYKKVGEFLRGGIQHKEADYKHYVVRNLKQAEWLFSALSKSEMFSFDIETSSYDYLDSKILSISFSWQNRTAVTLPFYYQGLKPFWNDSEFEKVFNGLKFVLENPAVKKIAHNGKFDMQHLRSFGIKVENFYVDSMLMHYLIDENSFHDLKTLAWIYTDVGGYDREFDEERKKIARDRGIGSYESVSFADLPHEKLWKYSNLDADVTFRLFNIFWPMLKREKLEDIFFEFYMPMSGFLGRVEYGGVSIDREYLDKTIDIYNQRISEKEVILFRNSAVIKYIENKRRIYREQRAVKWEASKNIKLRYGLSEYENKGIEEVTFNSDSSKQLHELFINQLGLKVVGTTKKGNPSFDANALEIYAKKNPVAKIISERNKLLHLKTTFLEGIRDRIGKDGKVHTSFNLHTARTGRLSSSFPNLQNIPNEDNNPADAKLIRNIFIADPGCVLIEADYQQAEVRMWQQLSGDEVLLQDLRDGIDIHTVIASLGFGVPESEVTKSQRTAAKQIVFGTLYGRSPESVAEQLGVSLRQAKKVQDALFKRYKKAYAWLIRTVAGARRDKYVVGLFGQRRHLKGLIDSQVQGIRNEAERQAKNSAIQGGASQMDCFAAMGIEKAFKEKEVNGRVLILIHDSIVLNIAEKDVERAKLIVKEIMLNPHSKITVPLAIDVKVGKKWGEMEKIAI